MMEEDDGAPSGRSSPPTPKKLKMQSEEPKELLKAEDQIEDESKENDGDDGEEDEDEDADASPPGWQQSPLLLDMIDLPPSSPLPPTPPLPSSPRDLSMEQQDSEDEGPPPGWDNTYHPQEQVEHILTPANVSETASDIKMENLQQDAHNGDGVTEVVPSDTKVEEQDSEEDEGPPPGWDIKYQPEPELQTSCPSITQSDMSPDKSDISDMEMEEDVQQNSQNGGGATSEVVARDIKVEEQDSEEDEGPPPGWDTKCHPEPELQVASSTITQSDISDIKSEDVQQDAQNGQHSSPSPAPELVTSDIKMEEQEDSEEDEGPPPGWDSKCHPEPELQVASSTITQSDIKTDDVQQHVQNEDGPTPELLTSDVIKVEEHEHDSEDEGPPPGWDSKCQPDPPASTTTQSDVKTDDIQQDDPQPQHPSHSPPPQLLLVPVPSVTKVEEREHDSEDEGPPPGWDSKCQPGSELQTPSNPITPPSDSKIEDDDQQEDEGPPPGWEQQSQHHSNLPSPILPSGARMDMECEQKNVVERPQPPSRQQSISPIKPQISVFKPPPPTINPEMGQMVCGSCRRLLSYPKGARYIECGCCLEENYVLEEHEVGQVICGGCDVLLMYPYGAPKVRCVNCSTETEIIDQNRRPPLSEQQRRARRHLKRVQTGMF